MTIQSQRISIQSQRYRVNIIYAVHRDYTESPSAHFRVNIRYTINRDDTKSTKQSFNTESTIQSKNKTHSSVPFAVLFTGLKLAGLSLTNCPAKSPAKKIAPQKSKPGLPNSCQLFARPNYDSSQLFARPHYKKILPAFCPATSQCGRAKSWEYIHICQTPLSFLPGHITPKLLAGIFARPHYDWKNSFRCHNNGCAICQNCRFS